MNEEITKEEKIALVKTLRVNIDATINEAKALADKLQSFHGKREASLVITKLQEGKMWAGKILEELGSELPKQFQDKAE